MVCLPEEGTLRVSGFVKTSADFTGEAKVIVQRNNGSQGALAWEMVVDASGTHEWKRFWSTDVPLPLKGAGKAAITTETRHSIGKFWIDEIEVEYIPPAGTPGR